MLKQVASLVKERTTMKRTEWAIAVRQTSLYIVYRSVMEQDGRYYIRDNGELFDVTDRQDRFTAKWIVKEK